MGSNKMPFDSFFKELVSSNNKVNEKILCYCRHPKKGNLKMQPEGSYQYEGECNPEKACFKIQFDCARSTSRNLQVLTKGSPKRRKEWAVRPTLDEFFSENDLSRLRTDKESR
ncbi:MAG: hypothetical protein ACXACP_08410, partial [Candidatus Hodarchaeales archaeon]|jgi:hypothetical protein